jgi:hypothetical protein
MTNKSLQRIIDNFCCQSKKNKLTTFVSQGLISKNVILVEGDAFEVSPPYNPRKILLSDFYLIKNDFNQIVGIVYDMRDDLHWYIVPRFRKLGYLTKILKQQILPYILLDEGDIVITLDKDYKFYEQSLSVAKNVGFNFISEKTDNNKNRIETYKIYYSNDEKSE